MEFMRNFTVMFFCVFALIAVPTAVTGFVMWGLHYLMGYNPIVPVAAVVFGASTACAEVYAISRARTT